jgi:hypothetical protein
VFSDEGDDVVIFDIFLPEIFLSVSKRHIHIQGRTNTIQQGKGDGMEN